MGHGPFIDRACNPVPRGWHQVPWCITHALSWRAYLNSKLKGIHRSTFCTLPHRMETCRCRIEALAQNPTQTSNPNTGDAQTVIIGLRGSYFPSKPTTRSCDKRGLPTPTRADPHELMYNNCPFYLTGSASLPLLPEESP